MTSKILIVDGEPSTATLMADALRLRGHDAEGLASAGTCLERVAAPGTHVVVIDVMVPGMSGIDLCEQLREHHPNIAVIVLTARHELDLAVRAMRAGAFDYLAKPVTMPVLEEALSRALDRIAIQSRVDHLRDAAPDEATGGLAGTSGAIRQTIELVQRVARSDATVLVTGESGSGKERVARAVHELSDRRGEPFVAINCGAMPNPLLESELFGHVRGAFTGAEHERAGILLTASRGTILLDELADMPLELQAKLLRVLQERTVRPVGGYTEFPMRARVIAATSRDLDAEVVARRFRKDLYHRLNVVAVRVPALREREDDVLPLAQLTLRRCAARIGKPVRGISAPAARLLLDHDWPGNVRELENCVEHAVTICRLDHITVDDLPDSIRFASKPRDYAPLVRSELVTLSEMKQRYLRVALASCGGNKSLAARTLGIDRRTISHLLATSEPRPSCLA
ncbi:MAG TPA: sigma-54 dependent transcriptional regulator [Kofleriaceae bacterium]|jgi:DNA-binding NtrC family response regulator